MSIQIDDGEFTRIHNGILEGLAKSRFTALEFRCLLFLVRATYGWRKKEDAISLSQWATGVGLDGKTNRGNMLNTLNSLVSQGVIYTRSNGKNRPATWGLSKAYFENETVMQPDNTVYEVLEPTVMQPDNTSVMQPHNKTVMQPHNHKRKKEILKKVKSAPKAAPHPAVAIFHDVWKRNPNIPQMDSISKRVTDLELWREACQAWGDKGHRPTNVNGMLDWYDHPERFRTTYKPPPNGGDYATGRSTNNGVNAIMDYVKEKGMINERN